MATPTHTARRALLKGALAAPLAASLGGVALASPETPIQRLFRQWEALGELYKAPHITDEEIEGLDAQRWPVEDLILTEPATNLRDFAIKVLVNTVEGTFGLDDVLTLECARLAGRDFAKLPRCLFESA